MQLLLPTTTFQNALSNSCALAVLEGLPPLVYFLRRTFRSQKGVQLSVPQYRALVVLDQLEATSLCIIAENIGETAPTTSRIISSLVRKGLVKRMSNHEDRRKLSLHLTAKGKTSLQAAKKSNQAELAKVLAPLSAQDQKRIITAMKALQELFEPLTQQKEEKKEQRVPPRQG